MKTLFFIAAALVSSVSLGQEAQIRAGHFIAFPTSGFRILFNAWMERVNAEGKGLARFASVVGDESIPGMQMPTALRNGLLDMIAVPPSYYYKLVPEGDATMLADVSPAEQRVRGAIDIIEAQLVPKMNAHFLGQYGYQVRFYVYLNKEVSSLEDFKGLKLRTTPTYRPFFNRLGAQQLQTARGETYTALERGVVDGFATPASEVKAGGWDKVVKYRVEPGFYSSKVHVLVNKKFWDGLREEQRAFLDRMARDVLERELDPKMAEAELAAARALDEGGMKVIRLSPAVAQQYLRAAYDSSWDDLAKVVPDNAKKLRPLLSR
jgi:TRAP-type C4-dicarboxylate transport system substrate-binding protein